MKGKLYMIPTVIAEDTHSLVITPQVRAILPSLRIFLVENVRTARRYLSSLKIYESIELLQFQVLDKDTKPEALKEMFKPIAEGESIGVLSESGCPGVADPGSLAVAFAHGNSIDVIPLVGPSSILLALMASGLNGQRFAFHGYLPIEIKELTATLKELERESRQKNQTQIFIETPYRNNHLFASLLKTLSETTNLTVATDLTGRNESIRTLPIRKWRTLDVKFDKIPSVFLFLASK